MDWETLKSDCLSCRGCGLCETRTNVVFGQGSEHAEVLFVGEGPGQNEVDFRYSDALNAADNAVTFRTVVKTIAARNGLYADFSPKPLQEAPGSGFHINISVKSGEEFVMQRAMGGILKHIGDMTLFLNPTDRSYRS